MIACYCLNPTAISNVDHIIEIGFDIKEVLM